MLGPPCHMKHVAGCWRRLHYEGTRDNGREYHTDHSKL